MIEAITYFFDLWLTHLTLFLSTIYHLVPRGQNSMFAGKLTWQVIKMCLMWMSSIAHRELP